MKLMNKWAPSQRPYAIDWSTEYFGRWMSLNNLPCWAVTVKAIQAGRKNGHTSLSYGTITKYGTGRVPANGAWLEAPHGLGTTFKYFLDPDGSEAFWYERAEYSLNGLFEKLEKARVEWAKLPALPEGYTGWYYRG